MGYRLHVQKKHIVEYADDALFNHCSEEINRLFCEFIPGYWGNDEDYGHYSSEIELPRDEFKDFIEWFKDDKQRNEYFEDQSFELSRELEEYGIDNMVENFQYIYDNSDSNNDVIHLSWF